MLGLFLALYSYYYYYYYYYYFIILSTARFPFCFLLTTHFSVVRGLPSAPRDDQMTTIVTAINGLDKKEAKKVLKSVLAEEIDARTVLSALVQGVLLCSSGV